MEPRQRPGSYPQGTTPVIVFGLNCAPHCYGISNSIPSSVYDILADSPVHAPCASSAT